MWNFHLDIFSREKESNLLWLHCSGRWGSDGCLSKCSFYEFIVPSGSVYELIRFFRKENILNINAWRYELSEKFLYIHKQNFRMAIQIIKRERNGRELQGRKMTPWIILLSFGYFFSYYENLSSLLLLPMLVCVNLCIFLFDIFRKFRKAFAFINSVLKRIAL